MRAAHRPTLRILHHFALAAAFAACLAHAGCGAGDPLEEVRQAQGTGDFEGSIEPLRELLEERPDDAEVSYLYGRALVSTRRPDLASWSLRRAMEDPEWLIPAGLHLAQLSFDNRDFNEVDEIAGQILERDPENLLALMLRADAHSHWKKDLERTLADTERVLELNPGYTAAYEPRIRALVALDRKSEAREELAQAGRLLAEAGANPNVLAWHCSTTARYQQEDQETEAARETWSECLAAHPADVQVVSGAMSFHDSQGELERSLEIAQAAYDEAPGSRPLRKTLTNRLVVMGRVAEAEAVLREVAASRQPAVAGAAWEDLGKLRAGLGEYAAAAEAIEEALELARQLGVASPDLEFDYADVLVVSGRHERALEVAEELSVPAHRHLIRARVAQERRQPRVALEEFEAGLRLWPDNAYARYFAAFAAMELGDFDRALEELRYSIRTDPGATEARVVGASLLLAQGRPALALPALLAGTQRGDGLDRQGQLLLMRIYGRQGNLGPVMAALQRQERVQPAWVGATLAAAAEGAALRAGPDVALRVLASAPTADYQHPRYASALRVLVRFAHEAGKPGPAQAKLGAALAAHPEVGAFQEIRGLDLELSGGAPEAARAAYLRALELEPGNAGALEGLGRLALDDEPAAALDFFDRAAAADPTSPRPKLQAARALLADGRPAEAGDRLDALLLRHPFEAEAALERARLDLEGPGPTLRTLERALRAVRFGGGAPALDLLGRVYESRGESELAARSAERAQAIREAQTSPGAEEQPSQEPGES